MRYDGSHKRDAFLTVTLGRFVEWVPVCPELEIGMGVPREAIRLVASADGVPSGSERVRLLGVERGTDWTARMTGFSLERVQELSSLELCGYVLKQDSPSCGMDRVPVAGSSRRGRGLFAEALLTALPDLPVEEEGRLSDPAVRENFVERLFAYRRVRTLFSGRWTVGGLVRFHTAHKLQLLSHSRAGYTALGGLVAGAGTTKVRELAVVYERMFMRTLARLATPGRHTDVMMHIVGHLKQSIDVADRDELLGSIEDYRNRLVPLVVPITLIRHHVRRLGVHFLREQVYLDPHPRALSLRNHV